MGALRYLAVDESPDSTAWCTNISANTHREFNKTFCKYVATELYGEFVTEPTPAEVKQSEEIFARLGFPGCFCQADGVHCAWDAAPYSQQQLYVGKEGYPTVVWNVCVLYSKKIIHIAECTPGKRNDQTLARHDKFFLKVKSGDYYPNQKFRVRTKEPGPGESDNACFDELSGLYIMVDGGYHCWQCLMSPFINSSNGSEEAWSRRLGSTRKAVECTFGILKKRFGILHHPFFLQSATDIDNIFRTCAVLHNMLLEYDGHDSVGTYNSDWKKSVRKATAVSMHPSVVRAPSANRVYAEVEPGFLNRRKMLVQHFALEYNADRLLWTKPALMIRSGLAWDAHEQSYVFDDAASPYVSD